MHIHHNHFYVNTLIVVVVIEPLSLFIHPSAAASTEFSYKHSMQRFSQKPAWSGTSLLLWTRMKRNTTSMISYTSILYLLLILTILSSYSTVVVLGQQEYTEADLQAMTEEQLEDICIQRGFELVRDEVDPDTGELYQITHQDCVEAAMKCLAIEQEMNVLLTQYPELAVELEEVVKKMEEENSAKQAELEEIQQQLASSGVQSTESSSGYTRGGGTAFLPKEHGTTGEERAKDALPAGSDPVYDDHDSLTISDEMPIDTAANAEMDGEPLDNFSTRGENTNVTSSSELESPSDSSSKSDFTLSHLVIESLRAFMKTAKDDVKRIIALVVPVMQPLLTAGDVAWRQIKALFFMARDTYYESSSDKQQTAERTESEECTDVNTESTK